MAQILTANQITEAVETGKESYQIIWNIPNWRDVRESESLVNGQEALFETESSSTAWFKTKWLLGLKVVSSSNYPNGKRIRLYWKLLDITGPQSMKLEAKLQTSLWSFRTKGPRYTDEKSQEVKLLEVVHESDDNEHLEFRPGSLSTDREFLNGLREVRFMLKLTLKTPAMSNLEYDVYKMEQFSKKSTDRQRQNQAALLDDNLENADLKFVTSDEIEIPAHRTILRAQCPVFAAMLNCDLSENATGIIRMTDITGKTMKIILHYFYTGILLPSWRDPDTIVEFTYAAGKYQMTDVQELLDDMLGRNCGGDASVLDVQLINLAGKLNLGNAEGRLLKRIIAKIKKTATGVELFRLFGYEDEEIAEMAVMLATEQVGESRILRLVDYLYGSNDSQDLYEKGMPLLAFVENAGLKKVEKNLLKRFALMAEYVGNADSLFKLFGRGKRLGNSGLDLGG